MNANATTQTAGTCPPCNNACNQGRMCTARKVTEQDLDASIADHRTFIQQADAANERQAYCRGWRYGLIDGIFFGALFVAGLVKLGSVWGLL